MITKIIDYMEETIDNGYPYTLVLALMWIVIGWPLYIARGIIDPWEKME